MNIALFAKSFTPEFLPYLQKLVNKLESCGCRLSLYAPFFGNCREMISFSMPVTVFNNHDNLDKSTDMLFSLGGDGTLLDTLPVVRDSGIPILGVNTGRLGFLSGISKDEIFTALDQISRGDYLLDRRTLLQVDTGGILFSDFPKALNEVSVFKMPPSTMIKIHVTVNDYFLNSYWADGLIVSTPTGSTAYSLSCGGPIITPDAEAFVITPIASHNLTVRPILIPDSAVIRLEVESSAKHFMVSMDSRTQEAVPPVEITIRKEDFRIRLVRMKDHDFYTTIRNKLNWGLDIRN